MDDQKIQLVVAPNYRTFCLWCAKNGYHPGSRMVRFISKDSDLKGCHDCSRHELVIVNYYAHSGMSHRELLNRTIVMNEVQMLERLTGMNVREEAV